MSDLLESLRQSISCYVGKTVFVTNTDDNCILIAIPLHIPKIEFVFSEILRNCNIPLVRYSHKGGFHFYKISNEYKSELARLSFFLKVYKNV